MNTRWRLLLFVAAIVSLVAGTYGGLARLGIVAPAARLIIDHGALMICGLFGTLISLERAVAMNRRWPYLAPASAALGVLCMLFDVPAWYAPTLFVYSATILSLGSLQLWWRQRVLHLGTLVIASGMWLTGNLIWLQTGSIGEAVPAWQAFLILTIAGERLELSRFLPTPRHARITFGILLLAHVIGITFVAALPALLPLSLIALAIWLIRYDIVRHTIRQTGLPRYIALCVGSGYIWLIAGAALQLLGLPLLGHPARDAALHALLLGFVFSMVFGHAPIVLPAIAKLRLPYHPFLYLPLALLHATLAARFAAGLLESFALQRAAAIGNALTLLMFAMSVVVLLVRGKRL